MADHQVQAAPGQQIIDIVLPTYRMEPEESERFYPSAAKAIAEKILVEELKDQVYDEEEAKFWSLNISDKVREAIYSESCVPSSSSSGPRRHCRAWVVSHCLLFPLCPWQTT
jgi:hypothetical protein